MFSLETIIFSVLIVIVISVLNFRRDSTICGIYQQPDKFYYLKFLFMVFALRLRQLGFRIKSWLSTDSNDKKLQVYKHYKFLESIHDLGPHPKAVDAVYFNATSRHGGSMVCSIARRQNGVCNGFLFLKLDNNDELWLSPKLPDTTLKQTADELGAYEVEGIKIENLAPMKTWRIYYCGEMKSRSDHNKMVNVVLDLSWTAKFDPFDYNTDMAPEAMARDMAREPWSKEYFKLLKSLNQNHYEQMGLVSGIATINGKEQLIAMECLRDHSFAPVREWRTFHRYTYHFVYLKNGDKIAIGALSKPILFSQLSAGYYCRWSDSKVHPVTWSGFELYQFGERGSPPADYGFSFKACGQTFYVSVKMKDEEIFFVGEEREAKFFERWCDFEVNGIKGWGCVEWYYKNVDIDKSNISI